MTNDPHVPDGSIIITPAEVYQRVTALTDQVTRLVIQNEQTNRDHANDRADIAKLEERVGGLERKVWLVAGAAAALGSSVSSWLPSVLNR